MSTDSDLTQRAAEFARDGREQHEQPVLVNVPPPGDEERLIAVLIEIIMSTCVYEVPAEKKRRAA